MYATKLLARISAFVLLVSMSALATAQLEPINNRPNPYASVDLWVDLPDGKDWAGC